MHDKRTVKEILNQMHALDEINSKNVEYITSIDLMLTSENNGTVKDAKISKKFNELKHTIEEAKSLSKEFTNMLQQQ